MTRLLFLLCALHLLAMASAQIEFTVLRNTSIPNLLTLRCVDRLDRLISNPEFFRDGQPYDLPDRVVVEDVGVNWFVTRETEGSFQCATSLSSSRSMATVIVGKRPFVLAIGYRLECLTLKTYYSLHLSNVL